jgi:flavin-dependent dehydrogenase
VLFRSDLDLLQPAYKVAIIGGGPAGCACALALAQRGITDVAIIEAGDYSQFCIGESIPPEAFSLLQTLDINHAFLREDHVPCYGSCSYWGSDKPGYNDTIMNPLGHGWHLDRTRFNRFMATEAVCRGTHLFTRTNLINSVADTQGFELTLRLGATTNEKVIHAEFVIDASGTRAVFARQQGSRKIKAQSLVCMARCFTAQDNKYKKSSLTHLEASEHGWWYGAHLPNRSLLLAFYSNAATIKMHRLQRRENWMALLSTARSAELIQNMVASHEDIKSFLAPSYCLDQLSGNNWLAIGDAASAWDPIMSQGIAKAIANGIAAADVIDNNQHEQQFSHAIKSTFQRYLKLKNQYYQMEQRWHQSPFWQSCQDLTINQLNP